ncbi:acetyltransferase [Desulfosporosinus orientis DSM 765]|uniref:Acetyltransferase n=1 Tax=Desulfosporosinus orientis (strain ATCC 19365 / DSM 765 / NCIMB 8382 / VKM B-1628 / Singapore I) TaxID=768706 RepID=G7WAX3_DESOD|nr:GNAT family N-acetyltransferase [Desulfosporosinus orientis]AET67474.1 acetyltransferase [Desulfosporosinus orientis DSM 765]
MENQLFKRGLSDKELQDIRDLENVCCKYDRLNLKLNWSMLTNRSADEKNDLLYYVGNKLIGFLGLYDIEQKSKEIEIMGMVHPEYRRRGIFKELFNAVKQECITRGARRILLITERSSDAGTSFVKSTDAQYSCSEYRMKFDESNVQISPTLGITLRKAESRDYLELKNLDVLCFGSAEEEIENSDADNVYHSTYVAEIKGKFIGKIGVQMEGNDGYIYGFGIEPVYRRQGYGREVLSLALLKLLSKQVLNVILEVAVKNEKALLLYKSCGFKEITVYDYYEIILQE